MAEFEANKPAIATKNTGNDRPVPMKIDPVKESENRLRLQKAAMAGTANSSQTNVIPQNMEAMPKMTGINPPFTNQRGAGVMEEEVRHEEESSESPIFLAGKFYQQ